jgi:hypothetical protein
MKNKTLVPTSILLGMLILLLSGCPLPEMNYPTTITISGYTDQFLLANDSDEVILSISHDGVAGFGEFQVFYNAMVYNLDENGTIAISSSVSGLRRVQVFHNGSGVTQEIDIPFHSTTPTRDGRWDLTGDLRLD